MGLYFVGALWAKSEKLSKCIKREKICTIGKSCKLKVKSGNQNKWGIKQERETKQMGNKTREKKIEGGWKS